MGSERVTNTEIIKWLHRNGQKETAYRLASRSIPVRAAIKARVRAAIRAEKRAK